MEQTVVISDWTLEQWQTLIAFFGNIERQKYINSFIHSSFITGQGHSGSRHEAGIHPGCDQSPLQGIMYTYTHTHIHLHNYSCLEGIKSSQSTYLYAFEKWEDLI